jgi:predicted glycosyltransferase
MRFFLYSHDGFGLGHTRRHLAIAAALAALDPEAAILLASGADDIYRLGLPGQVEVLKLPGLRKTGEHQYLGRRLPQATPEIRALRSAVLESAVKAFRPAVTLVDKHPFGACGEFRPALYAIKAAGRRAVLGLRDILDARDAIRREWRPQNLPESIAEFYDLVLIYGEQAVFDPTIAYAFPQSVAARARFCGYVVNHDEADPWTDVHFPWLDSNPAKPLVLATIGGGEDGSFLLENFIHAAAGSPWQAVAIAGPMTPPSELEKLQRLSSQAGVPLHGFLPNLPALFSMANALVCMGGYNTISEALSKGIPTVCVPRVVPRSEQLLRARAFERLGMLDTIVPDNLRPEILRQAIKKAIATPRHKLQERVASALTFEGAQRAAGYLFTLACEPDESPEPLMAARFY